MQKLRRCLQAIEKVSDSSALIVMWLVLGLVLILCWEVLLRSVFNLPTIWAHESTQYLFGFYFALGGAYALKIGGMIKVDILINRMKPRTRAIVEVVTELLTFAFLLVVIWKGLDVLLYSIQIGERSGTAWSPPVWPIKLAAVAGAFLLCLQQLVNYVRSFVSAISGKERL